MKKRYYFFLIFPLLIFSQVEQSINSGNSKLHFRTFGKGKPLLIINGGPGMNCDGFSFLAESLAKYQYQTIIYDQRGTGKSIVDNPTAETITIDLMVQDIENLRTHLKINKWTILGHSFGGILATYYASKYPDRIDKLIFSSSAGVNMNFASNLFQRQQANLTELQRDSLAYFQAKQDKGDTTFETRKSRAKYLAFSYVFDKTKAPIIAERLLQFNLKINELVIRNLLKIKYNCAKKFKNFNRPVLILQGKNDILTIETAQEIATVFHNSNLILMENCAHYGWLDVPDLYFKSIKNFLNS